MKTIAIALLAITPISVAAQGTLRELWCRGKPDIDVRVSAHPSPRNKSYTQMTLRYSRSTQKIGTNYDLLAPGTCTWNRFQYANVPVERGVIHFDVTPQAQDWFGTRTRQIDTSLKAAALRADTVSVPRYLNQPDHFWKFFVNDQSDVALTHGAHMSGVTKPTFVTLTGPFRHSSLAVAELRCRGGSSLAFDRGASANNNQLTLTLRYRIASNQAGADAKGLDPGTCSWVKRAGMPPETGKIDFVTIADAKQARATNDRSLSAAAAFPDATSIPSYLKDPRHYWSFHVSAGQPDSARAHSAWMPVAGVGERTATASTERSQPPTFGGERTPATSANTAISDPGLIFREVVRKPNEYWIRFSARTGSYPVVEYSTEAPISTGGKLGFRNPARMIVRHGEEKNFAMEYSTAPLKGLPMNTKYYFVIRVPEGTQRQQAREYSGTFTTVAHHVAVRFTRIDVLNDSDKNSAGDLSFILYLTPAPELRPSCDAGEQCKIEMKGGRIWETGSRNPIDATLSMKTGAKSIRVWVAGADDDNETSYADRVNPTPFGVGGSSVPMADYNNASGEFRIDYFPEKPTIRFPFKLRSVDGSVLMFEVHGEIEVVRK